MIDRVRARCAGTRGGCRSSLADSHRAFAIPDGSWLFGACIAAVLLLAWLWCTPAWGLAQRGHVFDSTFGSAGVGEGEFESPSGVAVDEATGEVYVVDAGNERVDVFKPAQGSYEYVSEFKVHSPGAIAVDNSTDGADPSRGDVFVAGAEEKGAEPSERDLVYVYTPSEGRVTQKLHALKAGEEEGELEEVSGVAVDPAGTLWVYWEEEGTIDAFSKALTKTGEVRFSWEPSLRRTPEIEGRFECPARPGFAVAAGDEAFYAGYERESSEEMCPGEEGEAPDSTAVSKLDGVAPLPDVLARELDHQSTTGVAVDEASGEDTPLGAVANGDVYVDNGSSVAAFTSAGVMIQRFGLGTLAGGSGVAVDAQTGDVFAAEADEDRVALFMPEEHAGAPVVDGVSARVLSASSAELSAQIDPRGADSEYSFQYGTADCALSGSSCTSVPMPAGQLVAGFGDRRVSVTVQGLQPATAYFYRVLASNTLGSAQDTPVANTFTTLPSAGTLPDGRSWEMVSPPDKHGAAIEVVSKTRGGSIQASMNGERIAWLATSPVVSEPEGSRTLELAQLLATRGSEGWDTVSLETPHDQGRGLLVPSPAEYHYFTPDLSSSLLQPTEPYGVQEDPPLSAEASEKTMYRRQDPPAAAGFEPLVASSDDTAESKFGGQLEFLDATSDLQHAIFESKVGLTSADPSTAGLYEWSQGKPTSEALQLVSVLPDGLPATDENGSVSSLGDAGGLNARGAISSDGSRVIWSEADEEGLYLRDTGTGETIKLNAAQGNDATEPGEGGALPEPGEEHQLVHFQSASNDASRVFFTDTARLAEESSQEPVGEEPPADLYEFEVTSQPGAPLHGRLSDLTPDEAAGSADVLNLIPGTSEDGSIVYFIANGVLTSGASQGQCVRNPEAELPPPPAGATCNLYVSEADPEGPMLRQTRFVAALSWEDAADWGAGATSQLRPLQGDLADVTAGVSPDGRYLAFMSQQPLTGYDNEDITSETSGERTDEEVFLYDSQSGRLVCASCNPNQEDGGFVRPHGVFDTELGAEGFGLLVDRPEIWQDRWLAGSIPGWNFNITNAQPSALYQPRYLSDSGRLFFDSPDRLVPQANNGKEDVYEYEPQNIGSCMFSSGCIGLISSGTSSQESAFLDASQNGNDVFFLTAAQLVSTDTDQSFDIYDAHICSQSSPCPSPPPPANEECDTATGCRPVVAAQPAFQTPASATFQGSGNTARTEVHSSKTTTTPRLLTRRQKLARALQSCRKLKPKDKRHICEAEARKRYRAKDKAKRKTTRKTGEAQKAGEAPEATAALGGTFGRSR
jgi:hypothetical protein